MQWACGMSRMRMWDGETMVPKAACACACACACAGLPVTQSRGSTPQLPEGLEGLSP